MNIKNKFNISKVLVSALSIALCSVIVVSAQNNDDIDNNNIDKNVASIASEYNTEKAVKIDVEATAYTGDPITSTGTVPKWGTIAVDPKVIPYGTKIYIPHFDTIFIAEDCGSAIKGNKIDIFMDNAKSMNDWGRRNIEIYILEPALEIDTNK